MESCDEGKSKAVKAATEITILDFETYIGPGWRKNLNFLNTKRIFVAFHYF